MENNVMQEKLEAALTGTSSTPLLAGDLVIAEDSMWEIIDDDPSNIEQLGDGVSLEDGHYVKDGEIISYAVRGFIRRDYHQITPDSITKIWIMQRTANDLHHL